MTFFPKGRATEAYGKGKHAIARDDIYAELPEELVHTLVATFRRPDYNPPMLPVVAVRLLALVKERDVAYNKVIQLLEQDSVLAGRTLQIAQSAMYSGSYPTRSLNDALSRLGLQTLSQIVMRASVEARVFRCPEYEALMNALRVHNIAVAAASRVVARMTSIPEDTAFMCGLLHDVGAAAVLIALSEGRPRNTRPPTADRIIGPISEVHVEATVRLAEVWKLPQEIVTVLGMTHEIAKGGVAHPIAAVVRLAELLSENSIPSPLPEHIGTSLGECVKVLNISDRAFEQLDLEVRRALKSIG